MRGNHATDGHRSVDIGGNDGERASQRKVVFALTLILGTSFPVVGQEPQSAANGNTAALFDEPIWQEVVDLGPSPYYPAGEDNPGTALTCYYFTDFTVKEAYLGGKGAAWLSMLGNKGTLPECTDSHEPGERVIEYSEWEGYFKGVKDDLVLFVASEPFNGDLPFVIYDSASGRKVFEDSAYFQRASSASHVAIVPSVGNYTLEYLRVADASCDLHAEGGVCWNSVKAEYSLPGYEVPVCTGYEALAERLGLEEVASMIAYPVEVTLFPEPVIRSVPGLPRCWPAQ